MTRLTPYRSALALLLLCSTAAQAEKRHEFDAQIDLRWVHTDIERAFTAGGLGLGRFDNAHENLQLGRIFVDYRGKVSETLTLRAVADAYGDRDKNPIDLSEAFIEGRPYPKNIWRMRWRAGAFYPPVSLENRASGWQSPYTLSFGAINAWLGEEIRSIGGEFTATWMGTHAGRNFDISIVASVYGWNDPAGVVIFQRGWASHDRQTALFGGLPRIFPAGTTRPQFELFHEIDNRPGYYAGVQFTLTNGLTLRGLRYDNRGDPGISNGYENAWLTRFDSLGVRWENAAGWTAIGQWMSGDTSVGQSDDGRGRLISDYDSWFVLLSRSLGRHRLSARYDDLWTESTRGAQFFNSAQDADVWTLAYTYTHDEHWQCVIEGLNTEGWLAQRALMGLTPAFDERTVQLSLRYTF